MGYTGMEWLSNTGQQKTSCKWMNPSELKSFATRINRLRILVSEVTESDLMPCAMAAGLHSQDEGTIWAAKLNSPEHILAHGVTQMPGIFEEQMLQFPSFPNSAFGASSEVHNSEPRGPSDSMTTKTSPSTSNGTSGVQLSQFVSTAAGQVPMGQWQQWQGLATAAVSPHNGNSTDRVASGMILKMSIEGWKQQQQMRGGAGPPMNGKTLVGSLSMSKSSNPEPKGNNQTLHQLLSDAVQSTLVSKPSVKRNSSGGGAETEATGGEHAEEECLEENMEEGYGAFFDELIHEVLRLRLDNDSLVSENDSLKRQLGTQKKLMVQMQTLKTAPQVREMICSIGNWVPKSWKLGTQVLAMICSSNNWVPKSWKLETQVLDTLMQQCMDEAENMSPQRAQEPPPPPEPPSQPEPPKLIESDPVFDFEFKHASANKSPCPQNGSSAPSTASTTATAVQGGTRSTAPRSASTAEDGTSPRGGATSPSNRTPTPLPRPFHSQHQVLPPFYHPPSSQPTNGASEVQELTHQHYIDSQVPAQQYAFGPPQGQAPLPQFPLPVTISTWEPTWEPTTSSNSPSEFPTAAPPLHYPYSSGSGAGHGSWSGSGAGLGGAGLDKLPDFPVPESAPWTCTSCTYRHGGNESSYLSCK
eukprot:gene28620-31791_t